MSNKKPPKVLPNVDEANYPLKSINEVNTDLEKANASIVGGHRDKPYVPHVNQGTAQDAATQVKLDKLTEQAAPRAPSPGDAQNALFDFAIALNKMKSGFRVTRKSWHSSQIIVVQFPDRGSLMTQPYLCSVAYDGSTVPWAASNEDYFARDWHAVI